MEIDFRRYVAAVLVFSIAVAQGAANRRPDPPQKASADTRSVGFLIRAVQCCFVGADLCSDLRSWPLSKVECSRSCVALNCNSIGIRYGKFCGVGWTGCPGEKPCDELDACCKIHDECVDKSGMTSIECHESFKRCIKRTKKTGKAGFSRECPYEVAMPTMIQGMDMAILFSQLGSSKYDL